MARYLACGAMVTQLAYKGSKEGIKKTLRAKDCLEGSQKIFWETL
jgi:hypothetical protein